MSFKTLSLAALLVTAQSNQESACDGAQDENSLMQQPLVTAHMLSTGSDQGDWPARIADAVESLNFHFPNISVNPPNFSNIPFGRADESEGDSVPELKSASNNWGQDSAPAAPAIPASPATPAAPAAPAAEEEAKPANWGELAFEGLVEEALAEEAQGVPPVVEVVPGAAAAVADAVAPHVGAAVAAVADAAAPHVAAAMADAAAAAADEVAPGAAAAVVTAVTSAVETPVAETPVAETPVAETPVVETPVAETPVAETPVAETPVAETPVAETPVPAMARIAEAAAAIAAAAEAPGAQVPAVARTDVIAEVLGTDVNITEPLWEIERHMALAAIGLAGKLGSSANATNTLLAAQRVLSAVEGSAASALGNASGALLNASIAAVRNANVSDVLDSVRNSTAGVVDNVRNANVTDVLDTMRNTTAGVVDNVRNANVSDVIDNVRNTTAGVIEDVSAALENVSIGNLTSDMMNVVRENTADIFENVNLLIDAIGPFLSPALAKKHGMLMRVEDIFEATGVRGEETAMAPHAFQGDMVPDSESQLELFQRVSKGERGPYTAAGKPWTGGIVKYCFASDVGPDVQGHFEAAVEQVVRATCLQFENVGWQFGDSETESADQRCNEQPAIFVMSRPNYGCYSVVGESWMPSQQLQLQHPGCTTQGVILHEIGHALGMAHEHARPDRDQYIQVNWENIQPQWTSAFAISDDAYVDLPYEYLSLMHYDPYAFSKDRTLPTIQAAGGHNGDIGQRNGFAEADIEQLIEMYAYEVQGCTGRQIAGTGCVDMPGNDGGDICSGLAVCGGHQNERCCACGGGIEVQCYEGETCPNPPRVPRTNHIDCVADVTALFAAHGQANPENPCIIHNQCDMELKFKCREICTHTISAGAYQADYCHDAPVTDICTLRDECEVWDPSVVAQFADPAAAESAPEVQRTEVEDTAEVESSSYDLLPASIDEEAGPLPEAAEEAVAAAEKALADAQAALEVAEQAAAAASEDAPAAAREVAAAAPAQADTVPVQVHESELDMIGACPRPEGFCMHPGSRYVDDEDCDGDCIPDPYCSDDTEQSGFFGSANSCEGTWPTGVCVPTDPAICAAAAPVSACARPEGFCMHPGSRYVDDEDCDGDCIPDPFCSDDTEQSGFYGSANSCEGTWPTGVCVPADPAKCASMTTAAPAQACPRPEGFCMHPGAIFDDGQDCDGDGVFDPFCRDDTEQSGFFGSASGCESTWPTGVCEPKPQPDNDGGMSPMARLRSWLFR